VEALAAAVPGWLATVIDGSWQQVYGQRADEIRLPESETRRKALAVQYGRDGYLLLEAVGAPGAPRWLAELPAMEALRQVWVQQYYRVIDEHGEKVIRREAREHGLPPGRSRLISPYDTEARYSEKRGRGWRGYKVHLSETCHEPGPGGSRPAPNLIANVATTAASTADAAMTGPIHDMLAAAGLAPAEHAVDAGYASADLLVAAQARGITLTGPVLTTATRQARTGGYTADMFTIDWDRQQVTCPQGALSVTWCEHTSSGGADAILVRFPRPPAAPAPPAPSAPPPARAASLACAPAKSTKRSPLPAPPGPPPSGKPATASAPASKAPSPRPPTSPASAAPATSAWTRPASNMPPPQPRST